MSQTQRLGVSSRGIALALRTAPFSFTPNEYSTPATHVMPDMPRKTSAGRDVSPFEFRYSGPCVPLHRPLRVSAPSPVREKLHAPKEHGIRLSNIEQGAITKSRSSCDGTPNDILSSKVGSLRPSRLNQTRSRTREGKKDVGRGLTMIFIGT